VIDGESTIAVIGAGTIGASWVALFAATGYSVRIFDPRPSAKESVIEYVGSAWPSLVRLGSVHPDWQSRLKFYDTPDEAVRGAFYVQENVPERLAIKHELFRRIEPALDANAIVASSASGLLLQDMQSAWQDPARLLLAHPFNPPHLIPLVELLGNERTSAAALDRAESLYRACGKTTIRLNKEVVGHVANRLQAALWQEAIYLVTSGVVSVEDLDRAVTAGPGLRWAVMGPHMLFSLGSNGQGIASFCERYADSFKTWWDDLGRATLDSDTRMALESGVCAEEAGRQYHSLSAERDEKIVATILALRNAKEITN